MTITDFQRPVTGLHILGEICAKETSVLKDISIVRHEVAKYVEHVGLVQVGISEHVFPEAGYTFVVLLAESHLSIHTWPELGYVTLDVFVCNMSKDNSIAAKKLFELTSKLFDPIKITTKEITR